MVATALYWKVYNFSDCVHNERPFRQGLGLSRGLTCTLTLAPDKSGRRGSECIWTVSFSWAQHCRVGCRAHLLLSTDWPRSEETSWNPIQLLQNCLLNELFTPKGTNLFSSSRHLPFFTQGGRQNAFLWKKSLHRNVCWFGMLVQGGTLAPSVLTAGTF